MSALVYKQEDGTFLYIVAYNPITRKHRPLNLAEQSKLLKALKENEKFEELRRKIKAENPQGHADIVTGLRPASKENAP